MSDEIGSVMMDGEEELVMPEIPVRPNNAIPVAIGIILILGSLTGALLSATMVFAIQIDDEIRAQAGYTEEMNVTLDMLQDSGMGVTLSLMYGFMSIALLVGGIMLIRKKPLGVRFSVIGCSMFLLATIVQIVWSYFISADYGIEFSMSFDLVCSLTCGIFCITLPLVTVLIPEGKAALYREKVTLDYPDALDQFVAAQEE